MIRILIVEDDASICELYGIVIRKEGYETVQAANGQEAWDILEKQHIDLVATDIMMPVMDGYEFAKSLREVNSQVSILMITAKNDYLSKNTGFTLGIDDYMTKPADPDEMVLRIRALLRQANVMTERKQVVHDTCLDYDAFTVTWNGKTSMLPQKDFLLLYKLISSPNKIFTRTQLMDEIWGSSGII